MPVVYRCRVCGYVLYVFARVGQDSYGVPTPSEVLSRFGGLCPRCGRPLDRPTPNDIVIKPNGPQELLAVLEEESSKRVWAWTGLRLFTRRAASEAAPSF